MGIIKFSKGEVIHDVGSAITTVEIITKGNVRVEDPNASITLGAGSMIGIGEEAAKVYKYRYVALTDGIYYSYTYNKLKDVEKVIDVNGKIAPILARTGVDACLIAGNVVSNLYEKINEEYKQLLVDLEEYPRICKEMGVTPKNYNNIKNVEIPDECQSVNSWQYEFMITLQQYKTELSKGFYNLDSKLCKAVVLMANEMLIKLSDELTAVNKSYEAFLKNISGFRQEFILLQSKLNEVNEMGEDAKKPVVIINALETILQYAGVVPDIEDRFKKNIAAYKNMENRFDTGNESRRLRKEITNDFLAIYRNIFMRSLIGTPPAEAMMFLMFGFVDEKLAGEENTRVLYKLSKNWQPDMNGRYLTAYEWLIKIYNGEVSPSRNEFDLDYEGNLKELKARGDIDDKTYRNLLTDNEEKFNFELKNMFAAGNRVTFGRITTYVPVFDEVNVIKTLESAYLNPIAVGRIIDEIRKVDYSLFYRERVFSDESIGITQFFVNQEVTPYVILMPNTGNRGFLWQEIEGRKRNTPGRMLISIFHMSDTKDTFLKLCGEFRWELCKTVQGVYWNNIQDPSLTSEYCDYLQFYKKNSTLSSEYKEKVRTALKKYSNNYREVFIADYLSYMKYERNGSLRLNKVARGIIANYCVFSANIRNSLMSNPQYAESMKRFVVKQHDRISQVENLIRKLNSKGFDIPSEIYEQRDFLNL